MNVLGDAELYVRLSPLTEADHKISLRSRNQLQRIKVSYKTQMVTISSYISTHMSGNLFTQPQKFGSYSPVYNPEEQKNFGYSMNPCNVFLYVQRFDSFVSLPLFITISDLMMMTSMVTEATIFYSFQQKPPLFNQFIQTPEKCQNNQYLQPSFISPAPSSPLSDYQQANMTQPPSLQSQPFQTTQTNTNTNQNYDEETFDPPKTQSNGLEVPTSPSCTLFHTGISMYADSFGTTPRSFNFTCNPLQKSFSQPDESEESIKLRQQLEAMIHLSKYRSSS